jgi:hypothetical protein
MVPVVQRFGLQETEEIRLRHLAPAIPCEFRLELSDHALEHFAEGRLISTESDSFWLPDTNGTDYRRNHVKTLVSVLKLIVVVAACYGADVASLIQPLDRAPARVLIGPIRSLSFNAVELATMAFYKSLFQEHDLHAAIDAMNIATPPGDGGVFFPFTAERMFLQILKDYYNDETNETRIAARVEPYMVDFLLRGMPPAEVQRRRTLMRDRLRDRHAVFDQSYRKFFFVDRYPEIANRFRMTYESCFMEAGPPRDMSSLC